MVGRGGVASGSTEVGGPATGNHVVPSPARCRCCSRTASTAWEGVGTRPVCGRSLGQTRRPAPASGCAGELDLEHWAAFGASFGLFERLLNRARDRGSRAARLPSVTVLGGGHPPHLPGPRWTSRPGDEPPASSVLSGGLLRRSTTRCRTNSRRGHQAGPPPGRGGGGPVPGMARAGPGCPRPTPPVGRIHPRLLVPQTCSPPSSSTARRGRIPPRPHRRGRLRRAPTSSSVLRNRTQLTPAAPPRPYPRPASLRISAPLMRGAEYPQSLLPPGWFTSSSYASPIGNKPRGGPTVPPRAPAPRTF